MVAQRTRRTTTTKPATPRAKTPRGKAKKLSESLTEVATSEVRDEKRAILLGESKGFEELEIGLIDRESKTQPRGYLDNPTIESYADSMLDEYEKFPPVTVFYDGSRHYLADGFHRVAAALKIKRTTIKSEIKTGSLEEAQWHSYSANSRQGLRRTNEDKRRAVESALKHPNAINMSDVALGKHLGVSENTIKKYRNLLGVGKSETRTVTKNINGKTTTFQQKVSSEKRSEAQKKNNNQFEYWNRDDAWDIPIPDDLLNAKIKVWFSVSPIDKKEAAQFTFVDKKQALIFSGTREIKLSEQEMKAEQKEFATPYLYAQAQIMRWVKEDAKKRTALFELKDKGFYPGARVRGIFGEGLVMAIEGSELRIKYDDGVIVTEPPAPPLSIIPVKEFQTGEKVRIVKRDRDLWPAIGESVVVVAKEQDPSRLEPTYLVRELIQKINHKGKDISKSEIIPWWQIEREDAPQNLIKEVEEKDIEQNEPDYYLIAIGCLANLVDDDLLKLKAALDREIKLRNLDSDDRQKFLSELVKYAASQGKSSPEAWAHKVWQNHKNGETSPLWEDFIAGRELGSGSAIKRDWEVEPGIPYSAFEEERIQYYISKGEPTESATLKAGNDLRNPKIAENLWKGYLRKTDRQAEEALKQKERGVKSPYMPSSFHTKDVTKEEVEAKLEKLASADNPQIEGGENPSSIQMQMVEGEKPSVESLQKLLNLPITKKVTIKRIQDNPQWGYEILDGQIIKFEDSLVRSVLKENINLIGVIKHGSEFATITSISNKKIEIFDYEKETKRWEKGAFLHPIEPDSTHWQAYYDCLENPEMIWIDDKWSFQNGIFTYQGGEANGSTN